jgi:hypothetical protein
MEPENIVAEEKHVLCRVTPVSKYLAMILFIVVPFLSGWIGYEIALSNSVPEIVMPTPATTTKTIDRVSASDVVTSSSAEMAISNQSIVESDWEFYVPEELRFTLLFTTPNESAYYESGIPGSSACCRIYRYDDNTNHYSYVTHVDIIDDEISPSKRFFARANVEDGKETVEVFSTETGELVKSLEAAGQGQTIVSSECGYGGYVYDLTWVGDNILRYGIFDPNSSDQCARDLYEYGQVEI